MIMAGIFLPACGNRSVEEAEQESQIEVQSELRSEAQIGTEPELQTDTKITLSDVTWDDYYSDEFYETWMHFSFNDGTVVDTELPYESIVQRVDYVDITGDGKDEVLIYRYFANTATEYTLLNFFRIEEKTVTEISPEVELEELAGDVWSVVEEDFSKQEYDMPILRLESYDKVPGLAYTDKSVSVGYQDGGWQILEWVDCPEPTDELDAKRTEENAWAFDYLALLDELEQDEYYSGDGIEYKLVYLDGDIPALAAGHTGYAVSVFVWHDGEITTLMDREVYGLRGRYWGCQPYQNVIYVHDFDNQSCTEYWSFYQISESYELEFLYTLSCTNDREKNLVSYYYQEDIRDLEEPAEITEEEFLSYPLEDAGKEYLAYNVADYVEIIGDSDIEDMRWQLGRIIDPDKEEAVFLRKITQAYDVEKQAMVLHFLFSNDTLLDMERKRSPVMRDVIYRDITGDGIDEVLVCQEYLDCDPGVYSQTYMAIDFFQIEEDVVTEISPWTQLEELEDELLNMEIIEDLSKEYGGIVLRMEKYEKKAGEKSVDESLMVGYRDGVWEILE